MVAELKLGESFAGLVVVATLLRRDYRSPIDHRLAAVVNLEVVASVIAP